MRLLAGLIRALVRLVLLPFRLALAVVSGSLRAGFAIVTLPLRVMWGTTRRAGLMGIFCFGLGVAAGLLLAPATGREVRTRLTELATGQSTPPDPELRDAVVAELAHAPRTWHLPQPEVHVVAGVVTLTGTVADTAARDELEATVTNVPGVVGVVNELSVNPAADADR